ncbi:autotransporter family protein [Cupriavidus pinatubonensis]|uniref:Autotransporter domain-containing protein n=2 Tax=Cupriavidus pinatubonensis TaxID=248026 RepID=A0ABM8WIP5_9BURK|nr:autotransporter outer membrane beta-barrel domain-containing protein [Cupriavidus pinatubonensis]CAG9167156.1 hypothetical protein LMG23994_01120 [Cupriavidus pinatubonensis]
MLARSSLALLIFGAMPGVPEAEAAECSPWQGGKAVANACELTLAGGTIDTGRGDYQAAVTAQDGGIVTATGPLKLFTAGNDAAGIFAQSQGKITLTVPGNSLTTSGKNSYGVQSFGSQYITAQATIVTSGEQSHGAFEDFGGAIRLTDSDLTTSGARAAGAAIQGGGVIDLEGTTTIITRGDSAPGLFATDAGSRGILGVNGGGNFTVRTSGADAPAAIARNGGVLNLRGNSAITTSGSGSHGLYVYADGSSLTAQNAQVRTEGPSAFGAFATQHGAITLADSTITTTGPGSHGLSVHEGASIVVRNVTVNTSGQQAHGAEFANGARLDLYNVTLRSTGSGAGLYSYAADANAPVTVLIDGGLVDTAQSAVAQVAGSNMDLTVRNGAILRAGTGRVAEVMSMNGQAARLTLAADRATLNGDIVADAAGGNIADITLSNGSVLTGAVTGARTLGVQQSQWTITADSTVGTLTNNGAIVFGNGFHLLTTRSYTGQSGKLTLNTRLGTDESPSDRLQVADMASGTTALRIRNAGGPGATTTGNGILVIDAHASEPHAFALAGPVVAGPYEYTLQRGSTDASAPQSWYLRSTLDCSGAGAPSPPCPAPKPSPAPPDPVPPIPNYRPEVSLYTAIAPLALQYGRSLMDTLHERMGDLAVLRNRSDLSGEPVPGAGWGRVIGMQGNRDGGQRGIYGKTPSYDYRFAGMQIGAGLLRHTHDDGRRDHAGVYGAIGYAGMDVDHFTGVRAGTNRFDGYTVGSYWTHYGLQDWYLDGVIQGTWYNVRASSNRGLPELTTHGVGLASSIEAGYPFALGQGWVLEPQSQLLYQWVKLDDSSDAGATVHFDNVRSLAGRVGARIARTWQDDEAVQPRLLTVWARVSAWYEFLGDPRTAFSTASGFIPFQADLSGGWSEFKAGFSAEFRRNLFAYASAGYQRGFDGTRQAWDGKLGVRFNW